MAAGHLVSADPARGSRRVLNASVQGWAGWQVRFPVGWEPGGGVAAPGCPPGGMQSAAARTFPGAFRRAGRARARPGCASEARRVLGLQGTDFGCHFRSSKHFFRPTLALRRARQASDPAKLIEVEGQDFFSGSAAVAAGHLVSADPVGRVGSWRKRAPSSRSSVEELFSRAWGEVGWEADGIPAPPGCPYDKVFFSGSAAVAAGHLVSASGA